MFKTIYNTLNEKAQLLEDESNLINQEIELLKQQTKSNTQDSFINKKIDLLNQQKTNNKQSNPIQIEKYDQNQVLNESPNSEKSLMDYINPFSENNYGNQLEKNNNLSSYDNSNEFKKSNNDNINNNRSPPKSFMESIKLFLKTDLYFFMKYYLYFIILISICFYILIFLNKHAKNGLVIIENNILFYIGIVCLFIIINDILETPMESLKKFVLVIIITLLIVYIVNYFIVRITESKKLKGSFGNILWTTLIIYLASVFCIYFMFHRKDKAIAIDLYNAFNYSINKNMTILICLTIYLYIYVSVFKKLNKNSSLFDILQPAFLGGLLMFILFSIITYIGYKLKIINRINILNSFISLFAIFFFICLMGLKLFMDSLKQVCDENTDLESVQETKYVIFLIFISLFIIWWLEDDRKWNRWGSMAFVFASVMAFYSMFFYSVAYPSIGMLSTWLMVEWFIIYFYRKQNSKNSFHFSFMEL